MATVITVFVLQNWQGAAQWLCWARDRFFALRHRASDNATDFRHCDNAVTSCHCIVIVTGRGVKIDPSYFYSTSGNPNLDNILANPLRSAHFFACFRPPSHVATTTPTSPHSTPTEHRSKPTTIEPSILSPLSLPATSLEISLNPVMPNSLSAKLGQGEIRH